MGNPHLESGVEKRLGRAINDVRELKRDRQYLERLLSLILTDQDKDDMPERIVKEAERIKTIVDAR